MLSLTLSGLSQPMADYLYAATASDLAAAVGAASQVITAVGQTFDVTVQGVALSFPVGGVPPADGVLLQLAVTMYSVLIRRELEGDARSLAGVYVGSSATAAVVATPAQLNAALATTSGGAFLAALWGTPLFVSAAAAANVAAQPATFHAVAASAPSAAAPAATSNSVAVGVGVAVGVVVLAVAVLVVIRARRGKSPMGGSKAAATTSSDWAGPTPNPVKVNRGAVPTAPV